MGIFYACVSGWYILAEHRWVILSERRRLEIGDVFIGRKRKYSVHRGTLQLAIDVVEN